MADPGIGVGAGGMIASLFNPGLASNVAQHITPNPILWPSKASQGTGRSTAWETPPGPILPSQRSPSPILRTPPTSPSSPIRPIRPTPRNDALSAHERAIEQLQPQPPGHRRGVRHCAAAGGQAECAARRRRQSRRRPGRSRRHPGDAGQTIEDNRNARFMGNAAIFAQIIVASSGENVRSASTELMNNKGSAGTVAGAAARETRPRTDTQKDADAATNAWAIAHPNATPKRLPTTKPT